MKEFISDKIQYGFLNDKYKYIHVGYGTDENYFKYVITSITSLLNYNSNISFCFHIVLDKRNDVQIEKLKKIISETKSVFFLYIIKDDVFSECITLKFYNKAIYYRYLLPYIVETNDNIYYFDSDVICVKSAESFFYGFDLQDKAIAAIIDISKNVKERVAALNLSSNRYFNSGVLIFNAKKWRENDLIESLCEYIKEYGSILKFPDQDALNVILEKDVLLINKRFNCINVLNVDKKDIVFLHLANHPKPWSKLWQYNPMCIEWVNEEVAKYFKEKDESKVAFTDRLKWLIKKIVYPFLQGREQKDCHEA